MSAELRIARNRVPALLDVVVVGGGESLGQRDGAVGEDCALLIADPVERGPLAAGELPDPLDNRLNHIRAGGSEALVRGELLDPGVDPDGEDLVGTVGGVFHHGGLALFLGFGPDGL